MYNRKLLTIIYEQYILNLRIYANNRIIIDSSLDGYSIVITLITDISQCMSKLRSREEPEASILQASPKRVCGDE